MPRGQGGRRRQPSAADLDASPVDSPRSPLGALPLRGRRRSDHLDAIRHHMPGHADQLDVLRLLSDGWWVPAAAARRPPPPVPAARCAAARSPNPCLHGPLPARPPVGTPRMRV